MSVMTVLAILAPSPIALAQSSGMAPDMADATPAAKPNEVHKQIEETLSLDEATCYISSLGGHKTDYVGFFNKCKPKEGVGLGVGKLEATPEGTVFTLIFCIGYCGGLKRGVPIKVPEESINNITGAPSEQNIQPGVVNVINEKERAKQAAAKKQKAQQAAEEKRKTREAATEQAKERAKELAVAQAEKNAAEKSKQAEIEKAKAEAAEKAKQVAEEQAQKNGTAQAKKNAADKAKQAAAQQAKQQAAEQASNDAQQQVKETAKEADANAEQAKEKEELANQIAAQAQKNAEENAENNKPAEPMMMIDKMPGIWPAMERALDGKISLKTDVGYAYNLSQPSNFKSLGLSSSKFSTVGYGVSLGYTHRVGVGLSADYLSFKNKVNGTGLGDNAVYQYGYNATYNILTLTPNYRFKLDSDGHFAIRIGFGVGVDIPIISWNKSRNTSARAGGLRVVGNASYTINTSSNVGNCGAGNVTYTDSVNEPDGVSHCTGVSGLFGPGATGKGFTDKYLSQFFVPERGDIRSFDHRTLLGIGADDTHPISFGVWRRLFYIPPAHWPTFDTTGSAWPTESRAEYVARCRHVSCEAQAATPAGGEAAARIVEGDIGFLLTNLGPEATPVPTNIGPHALPVHNPGETAKDIGVVIVPQVSFEYDYGILHADMNIRYFHEFKKTKLYDDEDEQLNDALNVNYTSKSGPIGIFVGGGLGVNF
ncbi:MAG: hypothetical protein QM529_07715 [Hydrotalea sp.]|nr:hypothetical protein [Hydrotalea sp.]